MNLCSSISAFRSILDLSPKLRAALTDGAVSFSSFSQYLYSISITALTISLPCALSLRYFLIISSSSELNDY